MNIQLYYAEQEYARRKVRETHPHGHFDKQGRWFPDATEARQCCLSVRSPSRSWPYSLMTHCRTRKHVRTLYTDQMPVEVD